MSSSSAFVCFLLLYMRDADFVRVEFFRLFLFVLPLCFDAARACVSYVLDPVCFVRFCFTHD